MSEALDFYLPEGLPIPVAEADGLSAAFWKGLREERLLIQRCQHCQRWQHGSEWLCYRCHAFDLEWSQVQPHGRIYSWERVWHPAHVVLRGHTPYLAVLVELPHAGSIRMIGNLLGDPMQNVDIGSDVVGVFEHHPAASPPYSLLNWRLRSSGPSTAQDTDHAT